MTLVLRGKASQLVFPVAVLALIAAASAAAATRTATATAKVTLTAGTPAEFAFRLSRKRVHVGKVVFTVINKGSIPHSFKVCSSPKGGRANAFKGKGTKLIRPKKSAKLTIVFKRKGTYEYLCTVSGHAAAGMKGDLKVT